MTRALATFFALVLLIAPSGAFAATKKTTAATVAAPNALHDATVNLYCRLKAGKKIWSASGSGVFVDARGVILTNAHVAQQIYFSG